MVDFYGFLTRTRRRADGARPSVCCEQLEERRLLSGRGLAGYYFEGTDFTSVKFARQDTQVLFNWDQGTPNSTIAPGGFGVRWSGRVLPKFSEMYHFYTRTTGGVRLWVDGKLLIDDWTPHPLKDNKGSIPLNANQRYDLRIEYFDTGTPSRAELHWASKRQAREVIPQNRLFASERDITAPSAPHKLKATYVTDSAFKWMWSPASDESDTIIYETYIGRTKLGATADMSFARGGRMPETGYSVTVRAVDFAGNVSISEPLMIKTLPPMVRSAGRGLAAMYFREPDFSNFGLTRTDPTVNFEWDQTPFGESNRPFSARWEGVVQAMYTEAHTFALISNGPARLWLNDRLLIDATGERPISSEHHAVVKLQEQRRYTIRVEYQHAQGNPVFKLLWWGLSTGRQPIPASQLFPKFVDSTPPEAPAALTAGEITDASISLSWSEPADDVGVAQYDVYRFGSFVRTVREPRLTDTGLASDTAYTYTVVAVDGAGRRSSPSNALTPRTAPAPRSALSRIAADSFNDASGVIRSNGVISSLDDGDWVRFSRLNFGNGSIRSWNVTLGATVASSGGTIELRIGSPTGQLIGKHVVQPTGAYSTRYNQRVGDINGPVGVHDLYLVFKNRSNMAEIESFQFSTQRLARVMAIGDSITTSWSHQQSYRYHLHHKLLAGGHGVDFVGSQTRAWNGLPPNFNFDQQHEAYTGYRVEQYLPRIVEWMTAANPEIVMIHLGTNDIWQGQSASSTVNEMGQLIDLIRSVNPTIKILLAQIVPLYEHDAQIREYNNGLAQLAADRHRPSSPIVLVDQNTGFSFATDMLDVAHPNSAGEMKMADRWYDALVPLLS